MLFVDDFVTLVYSYRSLYMVCMLTVVNGD